MIATPLPKNQAIIDMYAGGASYKTVCRKFSHGEGRVKAMMKTYAPEIMRTQSQQAKLSSNANKSFCLNDLGQVEVGPCKACGIEFVGEFKTMEQQTCGLCKAGARKVRPA